MTVSEAKFGIKAEKERQVFCFDHALLFSRKVEIPQTSNFKYEYKFKIPVSSICMLRGKYRWSIIFAGFVD